MKKVFLLVAILLTLSSCGVQWQYSTLNSPAQIDTLRSVPNFQESVDTLTLSEFKWKLKTDSRFAWDYQTFLLNQDYHWYSDYFWSNRLWRRGFYSPWDFYWNRYDIWNNWAWNSHFWWGHSWYRPWNYGVNPYWYSYTLYSYADWYQGPFNRPGYNVIWNSSRYNNVSFVNGRRNNLITNTIQNRLQVNRVVRNRIKPTNYNKPLILNNSNDQIIKPYNRGNWKPESSNNGRGRGSWEIIPSQPTKPVYSNPVQPRQIRGGSGTPVLQQTRSSINSSGQGRSGGSKGKN